MLAASGIEAVRSCVMLFAPNLCRSTNAVGTDIDIGNVVVHASALIASSVLQSVHHADWLANQTCGACRCLFCGPSTSLSSTLRLINHTADMLRDNKVHYSFHICHQALRVQCMVQRPPMPKAPVVQAPGPMRH